MAKTVINVSAIINSSSKANSGRSKIIIAEDGISTVRSKVDSKIMKRNNIKARLKNVQNLVEQIGDDVAKISTAINNGALEYQSTEKRIKSMVQDLRGTRSQKGSIKRSKVHRASFKKGKKGPALNKKRINSGSQNRGKWEAFFGDISYDENVLQLEGGILSYANGDDSLKLFGAEYENELFHLYDTDELSAYFAKLEMGNSEQYLGKLTLSEEKSRSSGYKFDTKKAEKILEKKGLRKDKKDETYYIDKDGNKVSKDEMESKGAPKIYKRKVTISEVDKTAGASYSLYEGNFKNELGQGGEVNVTVGNAEAHASVSAGFYVLNENNDKVFSPGVKAEVGTSVTALEVEWEQQWAGNDMLGVNTDVTATVGKAEATADVTAQVFDQDGKLDMQLGASASAEAIAAEIEGTLAANVLGGEIGVTGGVNFGIGAHADVGYRDGVVKVDLGVSVGLGVSLDVELDVGGMVNTVTDGIATAVDKAEAVWDDVKKGWNDFWTR